MLYVQKKTIIPRTVLHVSRNSERINAGSAVMGVQGSLRSAGLRRSDWRLDDVFTTASEVLEATTPSKLAAATAYISYLYVNT